MPYRVVISDMNGEMDVENELDLDMAIRIFHKELTYLEFLGILKYVHLEKYDYKEVYSKWADCIFAEPDYENAKVIMFESFEDFQNT